MEGAIRGNHRLRDRGAAFAPEARALAVFEARREAFEGRVEDALLGIVDDVRRHRRLVSFENHLRQHPAALDAGAHVGDLLLGVRLELTQP